MAITKIEFFPDYCSEGVWITHDNEESHCEGSLRELEKEFNIEIPSTFRYVLKVASDFYDVFEPMLSAKEFVEFYQTSYKEVVDWELIEHKLVVLFKEMFPELAHLVSYSNGHYLNGK